MNLNQFDENLLNNRLRIQSAKSIIFHTSFKIILRNDIYHKIIFGCNSKRESLQYVTISWNFAWSKISFSLKSADYFGNRITYFWHHAGHWFYNSYAFSITTVLLILRSRILRKSIRIKLLWYIKNRQKDYAIVQKGAEMKCTIKLLFRNTLCERNVKHTYNFENKINEFYNSRTL